MVIDATSTFKTLTKAVENAGYDKNHPIFDIAGEYVLADSYREANIYFFRHHFDLGKSTFGQAMLTKGDLFLSETHKQSRENMEDFQELSDTDTLMLVGWRDLLGIGNADREDIPDRITSLWDKEEKEISRLVELTKKESTPRQARLEYKKKYGNDPEILERWGEQFDKGVLNDNVIFATTKRLELLQRNVFGKAMGKIEIDEGVEKGMIEKDFGSLVDCLASVGVRHPDPPDTQSGMDSDDIRKQFVGFREYDPESEVLDSSDFDNLQAMMRKIVVNLYLNAGRADTQFGYALSDHLQFSGGEMGDYHKERLIEKFTGLWIHIAKKRNIGGKSRLEMEKHKLHQEEKLDKLKQLERLEDIAEKLFDARNSRLLIEKQEGRIENLTLKRPLMYYLWDFVDKTDTDMWILDATTNKDYYDHLFSKYRYASAFQKDNKKIPDWDISPVYLGEGNSYAGIEVPDMSYGSLDSDELQPSYERYLWNWNVDRKKEAIRKGDINSKAMDQVVELIERRAEDRKVGVITNFITDRFDNAEARNFTTATGTNALKDVDELYVIGKPLPHRKDYYKKYLEQYREAPDYLPLEIEDSGGDFVNPSMIDVSPQGGLVGMKDVVEAEKIMKATGTMWSNWWERNVEYPVFDAYFRLRGQLPYIGEDTSDCRIIRLGFDAENFIGSPEGDLSDLLDDLPDRYIVENWEEMPKNLFSHKEYVTKRGKLKKGIRMWKELRQQYSAEEIEEMSQSKIAGKVGKSQPTIGRWEKGWEKIKLFI